MKEIKKEGFTLTATKRENTEAGYVVEFNSTNMTPWAITGIFTDIIAKLVNDHPETKTIIMMQLCNFM